MSRIPQSLSRLLPHFRRSLKEGCSPHITQSTHGGKCRSHCSNVQNKQQELQNTNTYQFCGLSQGPAGRQKIKWAVTQYRSKLVYIYIYIYIYIHPFTGPATNHCPENVLPLVNNGMSQCLYNRISIRNSQLFTQMSTDSQLLSFTIEYQHARYSIELYVHFWKETSNKSNFYYKKTLIYSTFLRLAQGHNYEKSRKS